MSNLAVIDLFAGPGGWDVGARALGLEALGIEWDDAAVATRRAAGHLTIQADIANLDPHTVHADHFPDQALDGLIASPPCQAWSMAGKGGGRRDVEHVLAAIRDLSNGHDTRADHAAGCEDDRSLLAAEPIRWALALRPRWLAWEQVPPVLGLWEACADVLRTHGYNVWTGILSAERYGVPQTRKRAVLIAHRDRPVTPPEPTHHAYKPGEPKPEPSLDLFGDGLLPWVSMAEALGWGMTQRPYPAVACSSSSGGPDMEKVGGSGARRLIYDEQDAGRWKVRTSFGEPHRGPAAGSPRPEFDPATAPSRTVTTKTGDWLVTETDADRDADLDDYHRGRAPHPDAPRADAVVTEPDTPRTAHNRKRDEATAVRVTEREAAILQGFPPDYPWQGNKSDQFRQIGNAVPPPLASAILANLLDHAR